MGMMHLLFADGRSEDGRKARSLGEQLPNDPTWILFDQCYFTAHDTYRGARRALSRTRDWY